MEKTENPSAKTEYESIPTKCIKCGEERFIKCEDGWKCINCWKIHYQRRRPNDL